MANLNCSMYLARTSSNTSDTQIMSEATGSMRSIAVTKKVWKLGADRARKLMQKRGTWLTSRKKQIIVCSPDREFDGKRV